MFEQLSILLDRLQQADFLALVLEPVFFCGIFFGLVCFCLGFLMGDNRSRRIGLGIIAFSCFLAYPHLKLEEDAAPRLATISGPWSNGPAKAQQQRRAKFQWVFYVTGWVALVAAIASGGAMKYLGGLVVLAGVIALLSGLWLHLKEAEIYHPYVKRSAAR